MAFTAAVATIALFAAAADAAQQQDFSKVEVKTTDLGKNTYMLEGAGGNVTIAVGTNGVIMVDAQFAPIRDRIAKLKAAGRTEDQAVAAKPLAPDIQAQQKQDDAASERVVRTAYQTLKQKL